MPQKKSPRILLDIKPPIPKKTKAEAPSPRPRNVFIHALPKAKPTTREKNPPTLSDNKPKNPPKKRLLIFASVSIVVVLIYVADFSNIKNFTKESLATIYKEIPRVKTAASELNTAEITAFMEITNQKIHAILSKINNGGPISLMPFLGKLFPDLSGIPEILKMAPSFSESLLSIAEDIDYLKNNGLALVMGQKGDELLPVGKRLKINLEIVKGLNTSLKNQSPLLKKIPAELAFLRDAFDKNYISINFNISRAIGALDSLISFLELSGDQHILLILQNPSEARPSGGFIGSFGDLIFNQGSLQQIRIDDIYNADRQLSLKLIPPQELQGITKDWGARDANWFFDFPASAQKVIALLEQSDLYQKESVKFQGAVAINTNVLGAILEIIGPIELPDYQLTVDSRNFLQKIQYEVEAGKDKKPGKNPKRILSVMMPIIIEKLQNLTEAQKKELLLRLKNHFEAKDIMANFKNWELQNLLENAGVGGEVFVAPKNFNGGYLAVINTNIAGGKTDAFITQKISLQSEISDEGSIINQLAITRQHKGEKEKDWWYRTVNKNYIKILTPDGAELLSIQGNNNQAKITRAYPDEYQYDIDLANMEKTVKFTDEFKTWIGREYDKTSFGAWLNTPAGKTKTLALSYKTSLKKKIRDGMVYNFIFEKQSGTQGSLGYLITAPSGYIWQESGSETYEYQTEIPKAREKIAITLIKKPKN